MISSYIYGIHDPSPKSVLTKGWVVITHELGHDPSVTNGHDYSEWEGYGVIARLNNGYYPNGTIPEPQYYDDFAIRVENFVKNSVGCKFWIIGNEPNLSIERPNGQMITAQNYIDCFKKCRSRINALPGHENDIVFIAAIGPWNIESGDWIGYFTTILNSLDGPLGITLHTYTRGPEPELVYSDEKMATMPTRNNQFRAYRDFMDAIPVQHKDKPIIITETNQNEAWLNTNSGWVKAVYEEINNHNKDGQKVYCLCLYRWGNYDKYGIDGKDEVVKDFLEAQAKNYTNGLNNDDTGEDNDMTIIFEDGFEGDFYYADDPYEPKQDVSELECPVGWTPDWEQSTGAGINHRPEYKPKRKSEGQPEVRTGNQAVGIHTTSASHNGVLYRQFQVAEGANIKASVWAMGKGDGGHGMVVGIDPTGGTDFLETLDSNWGEWWSTDQDDWVEGEWRQISKTVKAANNVITVYLRSQSRYANNNAGHFDDFMLESDKDEPNPDPPTPPTPGTGLQGYIDSMRQTLDDMEQYIQAGKIEALPL